MKKLIWILAGIGACLTLVAARPDKSCLRLLYWNIQNGMWDGQTDHYTRFTKWVKEQHPDICVFCEASTIFQTGTDKSLPKEDRFLPGHWSELASRYGHSYVYLGGWRDNYPQVITSRYPIENIKKIIGNGTDSVVTHGAGWARIHLKEMTLNIVTLHTWPQRYAFGVPPEKREESAAVREGDAYRRMEVEYICKHTIQSIPSAAKEYWMMMGDFNARTRRDNWVYHYPEDDSRFLTHDYILENTPYVDLISERYPDNFYSTTGGKARIDFVYLTPPLYQLVSEAAVVTDDYTRPVRNPQKISNFWHPSDHRPIIVDFKIGK